MSALNMKPESLGVAVLIIGGAWWLMNSRASATTRAGAPIGRSPLAQSAGVLSQAGQFFTSPAAAGPNLLTRVGWGLADAGLWSQVGKITGGTSPAQAATYQAANAANSGVGAGSSGSPSDEQFVPLDGSVLNPPGNQSTFDYSQAIGTYASDDAAAWWQ